MVVYPFFCPWKTRRAVLRGALLAASVLGAIYGLEQGIDQAAWPKWLTRGDWVRCTAAGLMALPVGLIDYGCAKRESRAPLHLVLFAFVVALLGLLAITVAPVFPSLVETLRTSTPQATLDELVAALWPLGACTVPAALVFTATARERWRGSGLLTQLKTVGVVSLIGSVAGALVLGLSGLEQVSLFTVLLAIPIPFALLLPLFAAGVDWTDGRIFPHHDPTAEGEEKAAPVARVARGTPRLVGGDEILTDDSSGERVFSFGPDNEEEEEEEDEEQDPGARILGPDDDDSGGLDGIAAKIFENF